MRKLSDILALAKKAGDFGIEIEVEGERLPDINNTYWITEADGSLRNGKEYIFKKPMLLKYIPKLLKSLAGEFEKAEAKLSFSFRTSVHVHMNMQDLTYQQILNTIYTYLLLEAPLMNFCGESRKGNRFCLRLEDAEGAMEAFNQLFSEGERTFRNLNGDRYRYAAINVEALKKYGSLEFRAMEGNLDVERINTWCTALYNIREFAKGHPNPAHIYNLYIKNEAKAFSEMVLKDVAPVFDYPDMVQGIQRSFSLSMDLPFTYAAHFKKEEAVTIDPEMQFRAPKVNQDIIDALMVARGADLIAHKPARRGQIIVNDWPVFQAVNIVERQI